MKDAVTFRVISKGVIVNFNPDSNFDQINEALSQHIDEASGFFAGVDLYLNMTGTTFTIQEMQELIDTFSKYENVKNIYFNNKQEKLEANSRTMETVLLNRTIRSGQRIKFPTNIIIIGDVNPGAEIIAGGDIVVLGKLRGVVHAGATGAIDCQIIALKLQPTQLRIGNIITRSPDDRNIPELDVPERAYVKDGVIIVEELQSK